MLDKSLVASSTILWQLLHLIMKRWIHFSVIAEVEVKEKLYSGAKEQLKLLQSDTLIQRRPMLIICDSNILMFLLCSPSPSWHKCSPVPCTVGAVHHSLRNRDNFTDWSLQMVLQDGSIWQTTQSITCNLVDYLHIHIDYHVVPSPPILSYHSVAADTELHYWSQPINRDKGAQSLPDSSQPRPGHRLVGHLHVELE